MPRSVDKSLEQEEQAIVLVEAFFDAQDDELKTVYDENGDFTIEAEDYLSEVVIFMQEVLNHEQ